MATKRQEFRRPETGSDIASSRKEQEGARHANGSKHNGRSSTLKSVFMNLNEQQLANGLAWFSVGLGLAEVLAPRGVAKLAGFSGESTKLVRLYGLREIASGVGIFAQERPAEALWSRVAGDAVDLATLGAAFASPETNKTRLALATASVLGVTALDLICAQRLSNEDSASAAVQVQRSVVINRSPKELYAFWRDFQNLPRFMHHLDSVQVTGDRTSHWVAKGPVDSRFEWDAEIVEDVPNEMIAWRSIEGAEVNNSGFVLFETAPAGRGSIVRVQFEYNPPFGVVGAAVAKLFGAEPEQQVSDDLRRFKQVMETGEVIISEGTISGIGYLEQRPAQPTERSEGMSSLEGE